MIRRAHPLSALALVSSVLVSGTTACGGSAPQAATASGGASTASKSASAKTPRWSLQAPKSRVLPDVIGPEGLLGGVLVRPSAVSSLVGAPGEQRILGRMRIVTREGGIIERANDLLPAGRVSAVELPSRLGGGYVFTLINGRGTQIWRAKSWLDRLVPLVEVSTVADGDGPLVIGFDRLYLRMKSQNDLIAIDPETGKATSPGPLPVSSAYGDMVFVDGWRAVVETDLRGVLATFDAGATWQRLPIKERVKSIGQDAGDPLVTVEGGEYRLSARGQLAFSPSVKVVPGVITPITSDALKLDGRAARTPSPLGKRPLRVALEDGYADSDKTAVVIRGGALGRVSLGNGAILGIKEHAVPETASCHGIRLGPTFGFVCGELSGSTTLYEFEKPLGIKEVMRFAEPRFVTESGQGAVVVTGTCAEKTDADMAPAAGKNTSRSFCIRSASGTSREIRVRGDLGAERVIALSDGRVVVLVPPRPGAMGQVSIIDGASAKHVALKLPNDGPLRELETGMWLEGFQQSGPNELGGWVEAGGPMLGIRVKLDGTVTAGQVVEEDAGVLVSGPFGLAVGARGRALETVDGGLSWRDIELPVLDGMGPQSDERTRRCGPVGCALAGILRVGWGDPVVPDDLAEAPDPEPLKVSLNKLASAPLSLSCAAAVAMKSPTSSHGHGGQARSSQAVAAPAPTRVKGKQAAAAPPPPKPQPARKSGANATTTPGGWGAFRGIEPPVLAADEIGIDNGAPFDVTPVRAYVWGKRDSDWSRTGRYQMRFGDRFALDEVRSSSVTGAPWADETAASEAFGVGAYGYSVTWSAFPDPGGAAALVSACRGRPCALYGVEGDRPILPLRAGRELTALTHPLSSSSVRVGESWFFLAEGSAQDRLSLYRADMGTVRLVADLARPHAPRYVQTTAPRLVRRASGSGLGLYITTHDFVDRKGKRWVLPLDVDTGEISDPIDLGKNDFATTAPSVCGAGRDGWLVVVTANEPPADVSSSGTRLVVDGVELRMRLDAGFSCIEAATSTADRDPPMSGASSRGVDAPSAATFPLLLAQRATSKRYSLSCSVK